MAMVSQQLAASAIELNDARSGRGVLGVRRRSEAVTVIRSRVRMTVRDKRGPISIQGVESILKAAKSRMTARP